MDGNRRADHLFGKFIQFCVWFLHSQILGVSWRPWRPNPVHAFTGEGTVFSRISLAARSTAS